MAFSFNWAGMSVPQVNAYDGTENAMRDASNAAGAARGFERRAADSEYAKMLEKGVNAASRISEIESRIKELKARNDEIRDRLSSLRTNEDARASLFHPQDVGYAYVGNSSALTAEA